MSEQLEPFVGPRPFEREDEKYFFGRDQAASELVSLILAYPAVVLYAQSGAGKTSLLKARVLSVLEDKKDFDVLPIARVRGQGPGVEDSGTSNIYVANALRDLSDNTLSPEQRTQLTFAQYLAERPRPQRTAEDDDGFEEDRAVTRPRVLIFDQFEELFTLYPERFNDRKNFFEQLRDALAEDSLLRVVFSMREDYIAELDPYVHILPDSLRTRYRLERLRKHPARQAILGPLNCFNEETTPENRLEITTEVADALVDNLRKLKVHTPAGEVEFEGEFIEPVHLQIVCKALWEKMLREGKRVITERELEEFGNVNQALAEYFERAIAKAANKSGVDEGRLRRWFNDVLITPDNTRSTVLRGRAETAGISNDAIDVLANERLIRSETRDNREWYELSHDKLIEPIRLSFQQWLLKQGGDEQMRLALIARAGRWLDTHRADNAVLLTEGEIETAKRWTNHKADGYNESLAALYEASKTAIERKEQEQERALAAERQRLAEAEALFATEKAAAAEREAEQAKVFAAAQARSATRLRQLVATLAVIIVLLIASAGFAFYQTNAALKAQALAEQQSQLAQRRQDEAIAAQKEEAIQKDIARQKSEDAERDRRFALEQEKKALEQAQLAKKAEKQAAHAAAAEKIASAEARRQKTIAYASTSAAGAELMIAQQPAQIETSVKRALASLALNPNSSEGQQALRHGMALLPLMLRRLDFNPRQVVFTPDGYISAFDGDIAKLYDLNGNQRDEHDASHDEGETGYTIISPDGRYLATIVEGQILVKHLSSSEQTREKFAPIIHATSSGGVIAKADQLREVTFSPNGKTIAGVTTNKLCMWQVKSGKLVLNENIETLDPKSGVSTLNFNQSGTLISVEEERQTSIYEIASGKKVFSTHSPDDIRHREVLGNNLWATADFDTTVRVVDPRKGGVDDEIKEGTLTTWHTPSAVQKMVFSKNDSKLATVIGNQVTVWDPTTGQELARVGHTVNVKDAVFSPNGQLLATVSEDRTTRLWDLRDGRELLRMGHDDDVVSVSFSPKGEYLVTGSNDVRLWDISTRGEGLDLYQEPFLDQVVLSHDNQYVAVVTSKTGATNPIRPKNVTIFKTLNGQIVVNLPLNRTIFRVAFSDNDQLLFIAGTDKIEAFQVSDGKPVKEFTFAGNASTVEFSGDSRYAVAFVLTQGVRLIDLTEKEEAKTLPFEGRADGLTTGRLAITYDGDKVFLLHRAGGIFRWDKQSDSIVHTYRGPFAGGIKVSRDGRYVAALVAVSAWRIFDAVEKKPIFVEETNRFVRNVTFSTDGASVSLVFRSDNQIRICTLANLKCMIQLDSESIGTQGAFSDDNKYFASGGGGLVQVWSLSSLREIMRFQYSGSIRALSFSSDHKYVVAGATDGLVRFSLLRIEDLINIACQRTGGLTMQEWLGYFTDEPYRLTCHPPK